MDDAGAPGQLRPLGLGEIFDRAVSLYVRNVGVFSLIALVFVVPLGVFEYAMAKLNEQSYAQIISVIQHGSSGGAAQQLQPISAAQGISVLLLLLALLVAPFAMTATAVAVWRISQGRPADWRDCYADAVRHWGSIIVALLVGSVIESFVFGAGLFAVTIPIVAGSLTARAAAWAGIALIVIGIALFFVWLLAMLVVWLAISFALFTIAVEQLGFAEALNLGFSRIFTQRELGKAALVALSMAAINIGITMVAFGVELVIVWLSHSPGVEAVVQTIVVLIESSFLWIVVSVYYVENRVRREGLDVQAALDRLEPQTAT